MELFLQQIFNGVMLGSTYALVALGLTLVFGILQVPNFDHGHMYMLGAYLLGLIEALGGGYLSAAYKDVYGFGALVLILAIKPTGLFGKEIQDR